MTENGNVDIASAVKRAPTSPGCYLWKSEKNETLYVGKANNLRLRLKSYLRPDTAKTHLLMRDAKGLEWITTGSATEALLLEANLVKKYNPRYNVRLKDDKRYPFICISTSETYPRIFLTRDTRNTKNRYFGPYTDVQATRNTIALIQKIFPIRKVKQTLPLKTPARPCMNFHIGRCLGPCQGNVSVEEYGAMIDEITLFLEGKREILENLILTRMHAYSEKMNFERAALYRDMLLQIRKITERQSVMGPGTEDEDLIAMARHDDRGQIVVFEIRSGRLIGRKSFPLMGMTESEPAEVYASFIRDYYLSANFVPLRILSPEKIRERSELEKCLSERSEHRVKLSSPRTPELRSLLKMAQHNAELLLKERLLATKVRERSEALETLQKFLKLPELPTVIECYDISHFQGSEPVGSGVQFVDGNPNPRGYRHYKIKHVTGINDPAMIEEVIARRIQRLLNEEKALPDLIVIDGGSTQLTAALRAAESLGASTLPMIGLAKKHEEIYLPGKREPVQLDPDSPPMLLLRHLRDEAHRFGITHNRKRVAQKAMRSFIDEIPGIGPVRRRALLRHFRDVGIENTTPEELMKIEGIHSDLAHKIFDRLNQKVEAKR